MEEPEFKTYLFSYRHEGDEWQFEMKAPSYSDARQRNLKLAKAKYVGILSSKIYASPEDAAKAIADILRPLSEDDRKEAMSLLKSGFCDSCWRDLEPHEDCQCWNDD